MGSFVPTFEPNIFYSCTYPRRYLFKSINSHSEFLVDHFSFFVNSVTGGIRVTNVCRVLKVDHHVLCKFAYIDETFFGVLSAKFRASLCILGKKRIESPQKSKVTACRCLLLG